MSDDDAPPFPAANDFAFNEARGFYESASTEWCFLSSAPGGYFYFDHASLAYVYPYDEAASLAPTAAPSQPVFDASYGCWREADSGVLLPSFTVDNSGSGEDDAPPEPRWAWPEQLRLIRDKAVYVVGRDDVGVGRDAAYEPRLHLPDDIDVSPFHASIYYDAQQQRFGLVDRGSTTGTFVQKAEADGAWTRLPSRPVPVLLDHGDRIRIGAVVLDVHWHPPPHHHHHHHDNADPNAGLHYRPLCDSCRDCSFVPFVVKSAAGDGDDDGPAGSKRSGAATLPSVPHREGLRELKRRLLGDPSAGLAPALPHDDYRDRAAERRLHVGSEPSLSSQCAVAPPDIASGLDVPLATDNRGSQLLRKMGWKPGEALGRTGSREGALLEPIQPRASIGTAGLGSGVDTPDPRLVLLHQKRRRVHE